VTRSDQHTSQTHDGRSRNDDLVLVLNSGSSSLKFGVYRRKDNDEEAVVTGSAEGIGHSNGSLKILSASGSAAVAREHVLESQDEALTQIAKTLRSDLEGEPIAVGHRIVHGGPKVVSHQLITPKFLETLKSATHFAPLHIPQSLSLIRTAQSLFPTAMQFACLDDVFHRTMPEVAYHLPLPQRYLEAGVRRYGFHGLSYESLVHHLGDELPDRAIFAHLGSGSSVCALKDRVSIDTTMGLTPAGGVPMGTRCGDLDPGVLIHLLRTENIGADELEQLVNKNSGLFALSNGESSVKDLEARAKLNDSHAKLALDIYVTAIRKTIGSYAALLGGVDLLVFTGGIGEHSAYVRDRVTESLEFLDLQADKIMVIPTQEELQIARHCRNLIG
jgi:acetate kinase